MAFTVLPPYAIYTDRDGNPLDNGYIYIGTANQNPQTNTITVYWDAAGTIPATQPIRTMGGYAWRNGSPSNVYVNSATFSIVLRDSNGTLVYSAQSTGGYVSYADLANTSNIALGDALVGFRQANTSGLFASSVASTVHNKLREFVSVMDFGATGDGSTDDTAAIQAAINENSGGCIRFPAGTYRITSPIVVNVANTILVGDGSKVTNILNAQTNGDAIVFESQNTGLSDYLSSCGITGIRAYRSTDATSGAALRLTQCNAFILDDFANLNHPEGIVIEGGKEGLFSNIRGSISGAITGTPVANSSMLRITTAATSGATYQTPFTMEFVNMTLSGGSAKAIDNIVQIEACDGLHFTNAYWNYGNTNIVRLMPTVSGKGIAGVGFANVYIDGVSQSTGTTNGVRVQDDGFASASGIFNITFESSCTIGNVTGRGLYSDHPNIVTFILDPISLINCAGAEIDVEGGDTDGLISIPFSFTPVLTFTTAGDLTVAYTTRVGRCVRDTSGGVTVEINILTSTFTHTTSAGDLTVSNLPTASQTFPDSSWIGPLYFNGITKAGYTNFVSIIGSNQTSIGFRASGSGVSVDSVDVNDAPTGATMAIRTTLYYPSGEGG